MKILRKLFSRVVLVSLGIAIQLAWLFFIVFYLSAYYLPIAMFFSLISLAAVIYIINRPGNPQVKMAWVVPIMVFPLFGGIIFFMSGGKRPKKKLLRALEKSAEMLRLYRVSNVNLDLSDPAAVPARREDRYLTGQCHYLDRLGYPVYRDTAAAYYSDCRAGWERLLCDLRAAERFIFMEYFIIRPGVMWDSVLEVLKEKAAAGLDVRLMYDDVGSISYLPRDYFKQMEAFGIKCFPFNRYKPIYAVVMNHRDHRKITVIDGHIGYTGGVNFADEYIGEEVRFGEWKDNILRLEGEGVRSMTLLFLEMWNAGRPTDTAESAAAFMPDPARAGTVRSE
jgi:cardiolipin synthase